MSDTIPLLHGTKTTLQDALESEKNILARHRQGQETMQLYVQAYQERVALERLVAFHVGVSAERVKADHFSAWRRGGFNLAIPMLVFDKDAGAGAGAGAGTTTRTEAFRVVLRCPIPAKCGEATHPGAVEEMLRGETASYVWMQRHCPGVRIPHLYGFGFPPRAGGGARHFSWARGGRVSLFRRALLYLRQRVAAWLHWPVPSSYVLAVAPPPMPLPTGYLVLEHFGEAAFGQQLPLAVRNQRLLDHPAKMRNLFRGVSRILLSLARVPQPRIGAFCFHDDGTIRLDGRPASCDMVVRESEGAPRTMPAGATYTSVDEYVADLQTSFAAQFRAAPHAALDAADCQAQMAVMVLLRAVAHLFVPRRRRNGPFFLYLSDANAANFMVDADWNVTGIFDLQWIFAAPADVQAAPPWLTWRSIDEVAQEGYADYDAARRAFMAVFRHEEQRFDTRALEAALGGQPLSAVMQDSWASGRVWFYQSLMTVDAMLHVVEGRIRPLFLSRQQDLPYALLCQLWYPGAQAIVAQKLQDRKDYTADVVRLFETSRTR